MKIYSVILVISKGYFFPKFLSQAEILFVYTLWNVNENLSYLKYIHGFNIL